jgi:hypothetical protein
VQLALLETLDLKASKVSKGLLAQQGPLVLLGQQAKLAHRVFREWLDLRAQLALQELQERRVPKVYKEYRG